MKSNEYIELLKAARKRARREYILAKCDADKLEWMRSSEKYLTMIYQERLRNENNSKSSD